MNTYFSVKTKAHAAIEERYRCPHLVYELRYRVIADGRPNYVRQCVACGHTSQAVKTQVALAENPRPPPYDHYIAPRRAAAKSLEYARAYLDLKPALRAEYQTYLASPEWAEKRTQALVRTGGKCSICPRKATEVHHLSYRNIGNEAPDDLMAVCRECHCAIHGSPNENAERP